MGEGVSLSEVLRPGGISGFDVEIDSIVVSSCLAEGSFLGIEAMDVFFSFSLTGLSPVSLSLAESLVDGRR